MRAPIHLHKLGLCLCLHLAFSGGCGPTPVSNTSDGGARPDLSTPGGNPDQSMPGNPDLATPGGDLAGATVTFTEVYGQIIMPFCGGGTKLLPCHELAPYSGALDMHTQAAAYASLLGNGTGAHSSENPAKLLVKPGDPGHSFMIQKLTNNPPLMNPPEGGQMPYGDRKKLTQPQIDMISSWITEGALNN